MKHRITYIRQNEDNFNPSQLRVENHALYLQDVKAFKEHRLTVPRQELPQRFWSLLDQSEDLHIRWASSTPHHNFGPLVSRVAPGLHVIYTPRNASEKHSSLCPVLKEIFDSTLKCESPQVTFSSLPVPSARSSPKNTSQYYSVVPSLAQFALYVQYEICNLRDEKCQADAFSTIEASYLDIDYNTISDDVTFTAAWDYQSQPEGWSDKVAKSTAQDSAIESIEVGILNAEKAREKAELSLGGWLTVIGEDYKPKPTLFSFPARHHPLPAQDLTTYQARFSQPIGLHPTMFIDFSAASNLLTPPPASTDSTCALHAYFTLPSPLFIDRYQFGDELFLASQNLVALRSISGATDLEAPDWKVPLWGSVALFELAPPSSKDVAANEYTVKIPMHSRYMTPAAGGIANVSIPWPVVFWACTAEEGSKFSGNPFDRINLGYDGLFGPRTMFFHVPPQTPQVQAEAGATPLMLTLPIPVLDLDKSAYVESGTVLVIALGVLWIVWQLFKPQEQATKLEKEKKSK